MVSLVVNGLRVNIEADGDKPLLWALREDLGVLGPKYGCGVAQCGACRVLIDGESTPSCVTLSAASMVRRWSRSRASRTRAAVCRSFSRPGSTSRCRNADFANRASSSLPRPCWRRRRGQQNTDIDEAITNICRCGTYPRIRRAIHRAAAMLAER